MRTSIVPFGLALALLAASGCSTSKDSSPATSGSSPAEASRSRAAERMDWWTDARFGMFIHWGLYSVPAGTWGDRHDYGEWIRDSAHIPVPEYEKLLARFNPVKFDADAIVRTAKDAGMKYIVITSKHHDGFCLFDSKLTDWDVMSTPFHRDIMKELSRACAREGIRMCWYHSIMDWHHPDYLPRRPWERAQRPETGADFERYVAYMKGQLKELLTNYGPIGVLWFDGQWEGTWNTARGKDLEKYVRSLQPDIIINNRVGKGEDENGRMVGDYGTPEQEIPGAAIRDMPWETCMTMNDHWGYNAADKNFKSTKDLVQKLADIASKGGNFLLNVGPTSEGLIPPESVERLAEIGRWMKTNGASIYDTKAGPYDAPLAWGRTTQKRIDATRTRLYLHVFDWPADGTLVLPGLLNQTWGPAHLLADSSGAAIDVSPRGDDLVLRLPPSGPDANDSVVVLDVKGAPDLNTPPTISAASDEFVDPMPLDVSTDREGVTIAFTTDGSEPTAADAGHAHLSLQDLTQTTTVTARCFRNGVAVSPIAKRTFTRVAPAPAARIPEPEPGLKFERFDAPIKSVAELASLTPVETGTCRGFDFSGHPKHDNWAYRYSGFIRIPRDSMYQFSVRSDDGSQLKIDGKVVVDNDKPHSAAEKSGNAALAEGWHSIEVTFFENTGGFELEVYWSSPRIDRQPIPTDVLRHTP